MAYGDDRVETATDAFPSSIDGNWANGPGDYDTLTAASGHVQPGTQFTANVIQRTGETYADDQYCSVTVQAMATSVSEIWAMVRHQGGTDERAYAGVNTEDGDQHKIYELAAGGGASVLASTNSDPDIGTAGDILTCEMEGTTIRYGDDINGADAQRLTTTDGTLSSGDPGVQCFTADSDLTTTRATAWSGGDISAQVDLELVCTRDALTKTDFDPVVNMTLGISATKGTLSITGFNSTANLTLALDALSASLTLSALTPTVALSLEVLSTLATLIKTDFDPTLQLGANLDLTPNSIALTMSGFAPVLNMTLGLATTSVALTKTDFDPVLGLDAGDLNIQAARVILSITGYTVDLPDLFFTGLFTEEEWFRRRRLQRVNRQRLLGGKRWGGLR